MSGQFPPPHSSRGEDEVPPYGGAQYGQPAYGGAQYGQPQYGQPQYGQPAYGEPQYGQPQYGQPAYGQPYAQQGRPPYASWLERVGAALIDGIIIAIPLVVLNAIAAGVGGGAGAFLTLVAYALELAYFVWNYCIKQGKTGQTIGKGVLGIRLLRDRDGMPLGAGLSFARYVLHILDALPCLVGYLWPLWDEKRQTFADKIVSSVVVKA